MCVFDGGFPKVGIGWLAQSAHRMAFDAEGDVVDELNLDVFLMNARELTLKPRLSSS